MKLQFDANQQYQLDAVAAVTGLFDGQPQDAPEYTPIEVGDWGGLFAGQTRTELGVGNHLLLAPDKLLTNARAVQARIRRAGLRRAGVRRAGVRRAGVRRASFVKLLPNSRQIRSMCRTHDSGFGPIDTSS